MSGVLAAIALSLRVGLLSAALGLVPATLLGWWLARRPGALSGAVGALLLAPLVLPPVVTGLLLLEVFGRTAPLGAALASAGLPLSFSFGAAVLAAFVVGLPLYAWSARAAFEAVDPRYEELAMTLGAPPARVWWRVTLPLARPGLAAGAVLAFARGLGEFGATAVLAGNVEGESRTIAVLTYQLLGSPDGEAQIRPLVLASLGLSVLAIGAHELLSRRHRRRLELR